MAYGIPHKKETIKEGSFAVKVDKEKEKKKLFLQDIKKKGTITEQELLLVKRRLNDGTYEWKDVEEFTDLKLTPEQNEKGIKWLRTMGWGKTGVERSNTPFGYREEEAIKNFKEFKLNSFTNIANYQGMKNYVPVYDVYTKEGYGFQYYLNGGIISIVG